MKENKSQRSSMFWVIAFHIILFIAWPMTSAIADATSPITLPCASTTDIDLPLTLDGEGEFCHVTSGDIEYINSWNMQLVEINGVAYTNTWSNEMPARNDGKYFIHSVGRFPWSHLEIVGSGGESVPVTGVRIEPVSLSLEMGDVATLTAHVIPEDASERSIRWYSSDERIAAVDTDGAVNGVSLGRATITAVSKDGGYEATSQITVTKSTNPTEKKYKLTITTHGKGSTSPAPGTHTYVEGTTVKVTAIAANGANFKGWSGGAGGTENPMTLKMDGNLTLTANFTGDSGLPDDCTGACNAAAPVYPTVSEDGGQGNVTMYSTSPSSGGACNYGSTNVMYYAAINEHVVPGDGSGQWQGGSVCGQCAEVTVMTSQGPKTVIARIMDKCPDGHCGIDLGGAAPGALMVDGFGRYQGTWRFVSCDGHPEASDGPPSLDIFDGSNRWWSRVHVRNGAMAVEAIEWQTVDGRRSGIFPFADDPENTFEVPVDQVLQSNDASFLITIYYVDGTTATVNLTPGELSTPGASFQLE